MYTYTLAFIHKNNQFLLVNREKKPWKGCWNGLGGKIQTNETPIEGIIRELFEETGLKIREEYIKDCGILTWNTFDAHGQGLHLFLIHGNTLAKIDTPLSTEEGILDWKHLDWIIDPNNYGVAHNIRFFLPTMLHENIRYHYHCIFENDTLIQVTKEVMDHVS
jgi:8-oxo-dGTP diphosphatase